MDRLLTAYCRALEAVCALLMAGMVVLVFGNVVLRYFFSSGWPISEELSRWMFVWMVFIGAVIVMRERGHMGTDMVVIRLPVWARRACLAMSELVMLYLTWIMASGSWSQVVVNRQTEAPVSGLSVGIFYFSGVLFAASTLVILLYQLWLTVRGRLSERDLVMVQESEEATHVMVPPVSGTFPGKRS